ncbi:YcxB family protein [Labrys sp. KNU-23]|uniref:YcxB family protein n=1 Tax=Labrys sp. KNU-23 TaxID=2789216 RepID=UPI0011EC579C|nr:YcxB family protein [Labrys sp. KNU-23]QEN84769.1 YcxB family protein [Labrys sp. KNU-23]
MSDTNRSVTLTLTADDYVAANKLFILKYATSRWPLICWLLFVALLLGSLFVPALQLRDAPFAPLFYICVAVVLAIPFYQYFFGAAVFARKAYAAQKTLQHEMTVSWSEEGFRSTAQQGDWNIPWGDYLKWAEDREVFLLYQGPRLFNMLPKRVLTTAQINDFSQLVAANIKRA